MHDKFHTFSPTFSAMPNSWTSFFSFGIPEALDLRIKPRIGFEIVSSPRRFSSSSFDVEIDSESVLSATYTMPSKSCSEERKERRANGTVNCSGWHRPRMGNGGGYLIRYRSESWLWMWCPWFWIPRRLDYQIRIIYCRELSSWTNKDGWKPIVWHIPQSWGRGRASAEDHRTLGVILKYWGGANRQSSRRRRLPKRRCLRFFPWSTGNHSKKVSVKNETEGRGGNDNVCRIETSGS